MKIIQITVSSDPEPGVGDTIYALCDNGDIYKLWLGCVDYKTWVKLPALPEDK